MMYGIWFCSVFGLRILVVGFYVINVLWSGEMVCLLLGFFGVMVFRVLGRWFWCMYI